MRLVISLLAASLAAGCASSVDGGWGAPTDPPKGGTHGGGSGGAPPSSNDAGAPSTEGGDPVPSPGPQPTPEAGPVVDDAGSAPPPACAYPAGPYGTSAGDVLQPSLAWQGYAAGSSTLSTLHASDLFDCNGSKGINAIVLDESTTTCENCQAEAMDLEAQMTGSWLAEGVAFITLLEPDGAGSTPDTSTALSWRSTYGLQDVGVYADPSGEPWSAALTVLPGTYLVDPRTMKIVAATDGYSGPDPAVDQLALKNKM